MGNKLSLPGDCKRKPKIRKRKQKGPTRWQDVSDTSTSITEQVRTRSMEISLELMEIESQIEMIVSIDEKERTEEHLVELNRLIEYKELKSKELKDPNATERIWK